MSSPSSRSICEDLDPRIQDELEKLNKASHEINQLELELERVRGNFRQVLTGSTQQLTSLAETLGSCVDKARPYYDARLHSRELQQETQQAALRFERACGQLVAAKEMVTLAEEAFFTRDGQQFDPAWQEMLNHATMKVSDAEKERLESEVEHQNTAAKFNDAELHVKQLYKELKRHVTKSKPYFEMKARFTQTMQEQKGRSKTLENAVQLAKQGYAQSLRNLERISDDIHLQRHEARMRREMGERSAGVGEEAPTSPGDGGGEVKGEEEGEAKNSSTEEDCSQNETDVEVNGQIVKEPTHPKVTEQKSSSPTVINSIAAQEQAKPATVERRRSYERAIEDGVEQEITGRTHRLRLGFRRKQLSLDGRSKPLSHPSYTPAAPKIERRNTTNSIQGQHIAFVAQGSRGNSEEKGVNNVAQRKQDGCDDKTEQIPCNGTLNNESSSDNTQDKSRNVIAQATGETKNEIARNDVTENKSPSKPQAVLNALSSILSPSKRSADTDSSGKVTMNLVKQTDTASEQSFVVDETVTVTSSKPQQSSLAENERYVDGQSTSSGESVEAAANTGADQQSKSSSISKSKVVQTLSTPVRLLNKFIGTSLPERDDLGAMYDTRDFSDNASPYLPSQCILPAEESTERKNTSSNQPSTVNEPKNRLDDPISAEYTASNTSAQSAHVADDNAQSNTVKHESIARTNTQSTGPHNLVSAPSTLSKELPTATATADNESSANETSDTDQAVNNTSVADIPIKESIDTIPAPGGNNKDNSELTETSGGIKELILSENTKGNNESIENVSMAANHHDSFADIPFIDEEKETSENEIATSENNRPEADDIVRHVNEEVMAGIQRAKVTSANTDGANGSTLAPNRSSDSTSVASYGAVLDDEQILRAMTDFTEDDDAPRDSNEAPIGASTEGEDYRRLPARLSYLQEYVTGDALLGEEEGEGVGVESNA